MLADCASSCSRSGCCKPMPIASLLRLGIRVVGSNDCGACRHRQDDAVHGPQEAADRGRRALLVGQGGLQLSRAAATPSALASSRTRSPRSGRPSASAASWRTWSLTRTHARSTTRTSELPVLKSCVQTGRSSPSPIMKDFPVPHGPSARLSRIQLTTLAEPYMVCWAAAH